MNEVLMTQKYMGITGLIPSRQVRTGIMSRYDAGVGDWPLPHTKHWEIRRLGWVTRPCETGTGYVGASRLGRFMPPV